MKRTITTGLAAAAIFAGGVAVAAQRPRPSAVPGGDYPCSSTRYGYSPVSGPAGPLLLVQYSPSALGALKLDGKGAYQTSSGKSRGRYAYNAASGTFAFVSGPLKGWPATYSVSRGTPVVELAPSAAGKVGAIGSHTCRRKGSEKFADLAAPKEGGGGAGTRGAATTSPNPGFKGTLFFKESWGSGAIVAVDLATGRVRSRFEGRDPHVGPTGETVFVNRQGALVIADKKGVTVATIPVDEKDEAPDLPMLSPDGAKVAYHVEPIYWDSRVIVAARDGKKLAEFAGVTEPCWTPDGRLVVANDLGTQKSKSALSLSDKSLTKLARIDPNLDDAAMPAVSPDGKRVAFVNHGHVWVMNLDGTNLKQVTFSSGGEARPAWSPDGTALAVTTKQHGVVQLISLATGKLVDMKISEEDSSKDGRYQNIVQSSGRLTWR